MASDRDFKTVLNVLNDDKLWKAFVTWAKQGDPEQDSDAPCQPIRGLTNVIKIDEWPINEKWEAISDWLESPDNVPYAIQRRLITVLSILNAQRHMGFE